MHYLVTGGCGFIGAHLVERLLADKHIVTVIDDLSTGKRDNIPAGVRLIRGDITLPGVFDKLVRDIDGCFHLAAIASVTRSQNDWLRTHQVNLGGTVALFDALVRTNKVPVVFASSAAVYGDNPDMPINENAWCKPLSAYGTDKLGCELHALTAIRNHRLPVTGLRFFNVYGERQDPSSPYSGVISVFADRMSKNLPVNIYGDGEQVRDFVYVRDVVDAMALAMKRLHKNRNDSGIFNIATGTPTSINQLANVILGITRSHSAIIHAPARDGDIRISVGSTDCARDKLGFVARTGLAEGLCKTIVVTPVADRLRRKVSEAA